VPLVKPEAARSTIAAEPTLTVCEAGSTEMVAAWQVRQKAANIAPTNRLSASFIFIIGFTA
jgi:hypothetical protein